MVLNAIYISSSSGMHRQDIFCFSPDLGECLESTKDPGPVDPIDPFLLFHPHATSHLSLAGRAETSTP